MHRVPSLVAVPRRPWQFPLPAAALGTSPTDERTQRMARDNVVEGR